MLTACDPIDGRAYDGEAMSAHAPTCASDPRTFRCVDPQCQAPLVWKPGNGGKRPHWSHQSVKSSCAGVAMTAQHKAMQDAVQRWPVIRSSAECLLSVPEDGPVPSTLSRRRADVGIHYAHPNGATVRIVVECQNSASSRPDEERRITDLNLSGYPVLLVVAPQWIVDVGQGKAKVNYWVRDWAHRHGRRQIGVLDDGQLWWVKFTGGEPLLGTAVVQTERARIDFGTPDATGEYELGLCVDTTSSSAKGALNLLIAAPAWLHRTQTRRWPTMPGWQRGRYQPERISTARYLGNPEGWRACQVVPGGF